MERPFTTNRTSAQQRGYTLIEMLITLLILALLMSVALAMWQSSIDDSRNKQCRNFMAAVANAEEQYKLSNIVSMTLNGVAVLGRAYYPAPASWTSTSTTSSADLAPLKPHLGFLPICPSGGTLSVEVTTNFDPASGGTGQTLRVLCTVHGSYRPGTDTY